MYVKKIIIILLLVVGSGFLCYFAIKTIQKVLKNTDESILIAIPEFFIKDSKNQIFSKQNLKQNIPSVFIAFHPECEHCQYEAKSIVEKQMQLKNTQIVLFTSANDSLVRAFSKTYGLDSLKNVHVLTDDKNEMWTLFDVKTIPTIFIYNAQNQLIKRFNGETKIEAILKHIQ